jgi:hypothetical protein
MDNQPQTDSDQTISIVNYEEYEVERGVLDKVSVRNLVDVKSLEQEIKKFLNAMQTILLNVSQSVGDFSMETVSVSVEVNAKGQVSLLGSGGEIGGKGGLVFTFKRKIT